MNVDFARTEFDQEEKDAVNRVLSGYWLASGPENEAFEKEFANYVGTKYSICVNSGSAANLISLSCLGLPKGSKVLTSACGFPATLAPILHLGLEPVLVDYDLETHNINLLDAWDKLGDVKAVIFAHTMGNPVDERFITTCYDRNIPVIEDCCEAVGTKFFGVRSVGSFGTLGTFSFYPAHQITALGGGGMITTNDESLARECRSMRDWGKTWDWDDKLGDNRTTYTVDLDGKPYYRHYTYQTLGYNAKLPEACAAFGRAQLKKLDLWVKRRMENYEYLNSKIKKLGSFVELQTLPSTKISWFGYVLTLKGSSLSRNSLGDWLESQGIRTRPFFAGNITRHKPFRHLLKEYPVADKLMRDSLFVGIWQGLHEKELDYIAEKVEEWLSRSRS